MKDMNEFDMNQREQNENSKEKKTFKMHVRDLVKRGAGVTLCALLIGGVAFGGFGTGSMGGTKVLAAQNEQTLLQLASTDETDETAEEKGTETTHTGSLDVSDIVEQAMPSVVSITSKSIQEVQSYYSMFGYGGYAPEMEEVESSGSGIIVGKNDDELLVATNYHVVEGAETVSVSFVDNNTYEGRVKGYDEGKDLAIVAVPLEDISDDTLAEIAVAEIGSSDDLKVGEQVVAIGNALGYGQSVTTGIVSAKNRRYNSDASGFESSTDESDDRGVNLIQTDAAINPGNSGGALLNMAGQVVGINSAKLASTEVEGMGYAIAISDVADDLQNLMNEETRTKLEDDEHGVLGISVYTVTAEDQQKFGFPAGAYIMDVTEGSAAANAGLKKGMIITKFNGKSVESGDMLVNYLSYYGAGEEVELTVATLEGGEFSEETYTVTLDEKPADAKTEESEDTESEESEADAEQAPEEDSEGTQRSREDIFSQWGNGLFGNFH